MPKSKIAREVDEIISSGGGSSEWPDSDSKARGLLDEAIMIAKTELRGHAILETLVMLRKELFGR